MRRSIVAVTAVALAGGALTLGALASASSAHSAGRCHGTGRTCVTGTDTRAVTTSSNAAASATTSLAKTRPPQRKRIDDGSLGSQAARTACSLLEPSQISKEFGGPVGQATPTFPYCQWLIGKDSWLALEVMPHTTFNTATEYVDTLVTVRGLGQRAIIANNRFCYFTAGTTSYWLLYQTPGDFTALNTAQLVSLGHDVLAHGLPTKRLTAEPSPPKGPPIYFAGDSTAAGPEWAWWAYHENRTTTRTIAEYEVGSGLVAKDFFNWPRHLLAVVAERRPKLVIWMGGANDGQAVDIDGRYAAVGSKAWDEAYAQTVGSAMKSLVDEGCKVLWIGEPAMQSASLNSYMQVIDSIDADQAAKYRGVVFFNPGLVLNDRHGQYAGSLVIHGQLTPVRLDGIHLNQAGSVVLADAIAKYVGPMLGTKVPS